MIVFRPPILELWTGAGLFVAGLYQASTATVPQPFGDALAALLTVGGLGAALSWGFKSWWTAYLKRAEEERAQLVKERQEEREEDRREREHYREQVAEMVAHHREEAKFWRERYLAEHGDP